MRQNPDYILKNLQNTPYLLPVAQSFAEHKRSLKLNATGVYIWQLLDQSPSLEDLLFCCARHYQVMEEDSDRLRQDVLSFLSYLASADALLDFEPKEDILSRGFEIAGIFIRISAPAAYFPKELAPFASSFQESPDLKITIHRNFFPDARKGTLLLHTPELCVMDCDSEYLLLFPSLSSLSEIRLKKDGSEAEVSCKDSCKASSDTAEAVSSEEIFPSLRTVFLYLAQKKGKIALHSSSILFEGKAWLFSAPSGTGKSTQAALWNQYMGADILNGDLNLLGLENGIPILYGIPWCGTSGISSTKRVPLGGIFFLKQAARDKIEFLSGDKKRLYFCHRLISPVWTSEQGERSLSLVDALADKLLLCRLYATRERSAVDAVRAVLDTPAAP